MNEELIIELGNLGSTIAYQAADALESSDKRMAELEAQLAECQNKYMELIMAVARKFPNETRHQTALRYINYMEAPSTTASEGAAIKESGK